MDSAEDHSSYFSMTDSFNQLRQPREHSEYSVDSSHGLSPKHNHRQQKKTRKPSRKSKRHHEMKGGKHRNKAGAHQGKDEQSSHSVIKRGHHYDEQTSDTDSSYDSDDESWNSSSDEDSLSSQVQVNQQKRRQRKSKESGHSENRGNTGLYSVLKK